MGLCGHSLWWLGDYGATWRAGLRLQQDQWDSSSARPQWPWIWAVSSVVSWARAVCFPRSVLFTMSCMVALRRDDAAREPAGDGIDRKQARGDVDGGDGGSIDGGSIPSSLADGRAAPSGGEAGETAPDQLVDSRSAEGKPRGIMDRLLAFFHRGKRDAAMRGKQALGKSLETSSSCERGGLETDCGAVGDGEAGDPVSGGTGDPGEPRPEAGDSPLNSHKRIDDGPRAGDPVNGTQVDAGATSTPTATPTSPGSVSGKRDSAVFDVTDILPVVGDPRQPACVRALESHWRRMRTGR